MSYRTFYNEESKTVASFEIDVPAWVDQNITPYDVGAILQGGCASGAYMPAVTYFDAAQTMAKHGDDVLQYLQDQMGDLPAIPSDSSWSRIAVHYLSCAVELWAASIEDELEKAMDAHADDSDS